MRPGSHCLGFVTRLGWLVVSLLALLLSASPATADIGPKPSMDFTFEYQTASPLSIVEGALLECEDADCRQAAPLETLGPQRFTCSEDSCSSLAYSYSPYHRLSVRFSDGVERQSNVFSKRAYAASFRVTVRESDLLVDETSSIFSPTQPLLYLFMLGYGLGGCLLVILPLILLAILVMLVIRAGQGKVSFRSNWGFYLGTWVIGLLMVSGGSILSLTFPLTFAVEGALALVYAAVRRRPWVVFASLVVMTNLFTYPAFLFRGSWRVTAPISGLSWAWKVWYGWLRQSCYSCPCGGWSLSLKRLA